jgi:predicted DNA-binding transcriptional regulator YafY
VSLKWSGEEGIFFRICDRFSVIGATAPCRCSPTGTAIMRGRRLHRLLQVISLLRGSCSWNARKLADHFHTTRRNIHRDLAILELAGVPFWYDPDYGEGGGYRIGESFFFPHVGLTDQECFDLAVLARMAENEGVPLLPEVSHVRDKLLGTLPAKQQTLITEASALFDVFSNRMADQGRCRRVMLALQQALVTKKQVEGVYKKPDAKRPIKVQLQALRVFFSDQVWHLAAYDNQEERVQLFRLPWFQSAWVVEKANTANPNFSLRDFLGNAWGVERGERDYHIEIVFDADVAPLVAERQWHRTQELEKQKDGSLIFRATVSGLQELTRWLLSWGPSAKVLKPKELAKKVQEQAIKLLEKYERDKGKP